jgi:hypothetical protein
MQLEEFYYRICFLGEEIHFENMSDEAAQTYRRLAQFTLHDVLYKAFPLTIECIGREHFKNCIRQFYQEYTLNEFLYWRIPIHFCTWLEGTSSVQFTAQEIELLKYETLCLEILNAEDLEQEKLQLIELAENYSVSLAAHFRIFASHWPIHLFKTKTIAELKKNNTLSFYCLYRKNEKVFFKQLSHAQTSFLSLIIEGQSIESALNLLHTHQIVFSTRDAQQLLEILHNEDCLYVKPI